MVAVGSGGVATLTLTGTGTFQTSGSLNNVSTSTTGLSMTVNNGALLLMDKTSSSSVHSLLNLTVNTGGTARVTGTGGYQMGNPADGLVTLGGGTLDLSGSSENVFSLTFNSGTLQNSSVNPATLTMASTFNLHGAACKFDVASGSSLFIPNAISGIGSLILNDSGTLTLGGINTYSGSTTVNSGTLDVNATGSISTNVVTVNAGTLEMDNTAAMASAATLNVAAAGATVNLNYGGTQTINALYVGGVQQAPGIYGASPAYNPSSVFTGSGTITISSGPPVTIATSTISGDQLNICWNSVNGGNYNVFTTTSLNPPVTWTPVNANPIPATASTTCYTLPGSVSGQPQLYVTVMQ